MSNDTLQHELRAQAEKIVAAQRDDFDAAGIEELKAALQESRVQQVVLELQNEHLRTQHQSLLETCRKYTALYASTPVGYLTVDGQGRIVEANPAAAQLLDCAPHALLNTSLASYLESRSKPVLVEHLASVLTGAGHGRCELTLSAAAAGRTLLVESAAHGESAPHGICMFLVDISDKHAAEAQLQRRDAELNALLNSQTGYFIRTDLAGNYTFWNETFAAMYGWVYGSADLTGRPALASIHAHHHPRVRRTVEECIRRPGTVIQVELDKRDQRLSMRRTLWEFCCLADAAGNPVEIQCMGFDIQEQTRLRSAYAASERRYHQMFEGHHLPKLIVDPQSGAILDANPAAADFYGYAVSQLKAMSVFALNITPPDEVAAQMSKADETGASVCHFQHRDAQGAPRDVEVYTAKVTFEDAIVLYSIVTDITAQKQATRALEEAHAMLERRVNTRTAELEETKRRIEDIFNNVGDGILLLDRTRRVLDANATFAKQTGVAVDACVGLPLETFVRPEDRTAVRNVVAQVADLRETQRVEAAVRRGDGATFAVEIMVSPIDHAPTNLVCTVRDITPQKRAESALAEERNLLRTVIDTIPAFIYVKDLEHRFLLHNVAHARSMGVQTTQEVIGRSPEEDPRPAELLAKFRRDDRQVFTTGQPIINLEERTVDAGNREIHASTTKVPLRNLTGEIIGLVGITHDISELKAAELALRTSQERYRTTIEALDEAIALFDIDLTIQVWNTAFERLLGLTRDQVTGLNSAAVMSRWRLMRADGSPLPPEELPAVIALQTGKDVMGAIIGIDKGDDSIVWLSVNVRLLFHADAARPDAFVVSAADITEQRRYQTALRRSQQRLRLATAAGGIGVWEANLATDDVWWDDRMLALFGRTREEFSGRTTEWWERLHPDDRPAVRAQREAALRGEAPYDLVSRIVRPNGTVRHVRMSARVIRDNAGTPVRLIGVCLDVTDVKEAELALRIALEKELELGELKSRFVSMASHEFRTPLAGILATAETLAAYRDRMTPAQFDARLDKIRERVEFMSEIIEDLLVLARVQSGRVDFQPTVVDLDALCRDVIEETSTVAATGPRVDYRCTAEQSVTVADDRMMRQVLGNLIANALKYSAPDQRVHVELTDAPEHLVFTIADQGIGIPHADLAYLFEPFHRGSNVGAIQGTGLGLSIAMRLVELHRGTIDVASEEGVGTTFTLRLPVRAPRHTAADGGDVSLQ